MDELSMKFNTMIMNEIGLEIGSRQRLYDQDTGVLVQFEGKDLVAPGAASGREAQEFDPYNSTKMMSQMFSYYTDKLAESGEINPFNIIYSVDGQNGRGRVEMKNDEEFMKSKEYVRDQCKYADLILQINGDENPDLKEFDIPKVKETIKRKRSTNNKKKESVKK